MPRWDSRSSGSASSNGESTAAIRRAIIRLTEQREQVSADAGRALVDQAELARAVRNQHVYLARVTREIDSALELASDAADRARSEARSLSPDDAEVEQLGAAAAAPYEQTCAALRRQRDVVTATTAQLEHLDAISAEQTARTRELLGESVRALDDAIREQLRLLVGLERIERARLVAAARRSLPPRD